MRTWQLAAMAKAGLGTERRLALILPGDNGSVTAMIEGLIRFVPPADPDLDLRIETALTPQTFDQLTAAGYRLAIISCTAAGSQNLPAGQARIAAARHRRLAHRGAGILSAVPTTRRWSHVLLDAPLCL